MNENTIGSELTMDGANATVLAGRYRVVRQLGQGGMGSVWLAEDAQLDNRPVAIKMLPAILVANKRAYQQLKAEALVSLKLTHPNIAAVRAFEENGGNPFLVVDYIDGETLDDYLAEKGKLSEEETIRLLTPVAAALDYAHGEGVIHRDVKPANVMIRKDGHPFILDFGIAREIEETMTRMTGRMSSGTLMYMSPEQLNGESPSAAQDVYSFAAMAYECLSGHPPFYRGQIDHQILDCAAEPLTADISISSAVMLGLEKRPATRQTSCRAILSRNCRQHLAKPVAKDSAHGLSLSVLLCVLVAVAAVFGWKRYGSSLLTNPTSRPPAESQRAVEDAHASQVPVCLTNTVVRIQTNEVVRTVVLTNYVNATDSVPDTRRNPGDARSYYLEISRLRTKLSMERTYAENLAERLRQEYGERADALGIAAEYDDIDGLMAAFDVDLAKLSDLVAASNAWRTAVDARGKLDGYASKFGMARLAYEKKRSDLVAADRVRDALAALDDDLRECEASRLAPEKYEAAMALRNSAKRLFDDEQFEQAAASFADAVKLLKEAIASARSCKADAALEAAKTYLDGKQWQQAHDRAEEALRWRTDDAAALDVSREASLHLVPTLTLRATIDGRPIEGARIDSETPIAEGTMFGIRLPWTSGALKRGEKIGPFTIEYDDGRRRWRESFKAVSVDWLGPKTLNCPLREVKEPLYECEFIPYFKSLFGTITYPEKIESVKLVGPGTVQQEKDQDGVIRIIVYSRKQEFSPSFLTIVADGTTKTVSCQMSSATRKVEKVNLSE